MALICAFTAARIERLDFDICLYPYVAVRCLPMVALMEMNAAHLRRLGVCMDDPRCMDPVLLAQCNRLQELNVTLLATPVLNADGPTPAARFRRALCSLSSLRRLVVLIKGLPTASVVTAIGGACLRHPRLEDLHVSMSIYLDEAGGRCMAHLGDAVGRSHRLSRVRVDLYLLTPLPAPAPAPSTSRRFGAFLDAPLLKEAHLQLGWWSAGAIQSVLHHGILPALRRRANGGNRLDRLTLEYNHCALDFTVFDAMVAIVHTGGLRRFSIRSLDTELPSLSDVDPVAGAVQFHWFVRDLLNAPLDFVGLAFHMPMAWKMGVSVNDAVDAALAETRTSSVTRTIAIL